MNVRPQYSAHSPLTQGSPKPANDESRTRPSNQEDVTWEDVFLGATGTIVGGVVEGIGNTVSAAGRTAEAFIYDGETIALAPMKVWEDESIPSWLRLTLIPPLIVAGAMAPFIVGFGSISYGMFQGGAEGLKNGLVGAFRGAINDVEGFHSHTGDIIQSLREQSDSK